MYCEKCRRVFEGDHCPECRKSRCREATAEDSPLREEVEA